jgi:small subunit ribosomal protein S20
MPNHKSSYKRIRVTEKRNQYNRLNKKLLKKAVRAVQDAETYEEAFKNLPNAYSVIDKVTARGVIHKNTAARKKARLNALTLRMKAA